MRGPRARRWLNWRLGEVYAKAVERAALKAGLKAELIASHGQTIFHQLQSVFDRRQVPRLVMSAGLKTQLPKIQWQNSLFANDYV